MNRRGFVISTVACAVEVSTASKIFGQKKTMEPDLAALAGGKGLTVFNRSVTAVSDGARKGIHKEPSLVVTQLSDRKKGLVGPWVGNNSAGDFANFKIVPA